jgi:hypothetical protein
MSDAAANHSPGVSDTPEYREQLLGGPQRLALLIGLGGWVAFLVLAALYYTLSPASTHEQEADRFKGICLPYLTGFVFWTMVALGSVFFLCIQYVTGGRWGMLLRRPLEANAKTLWLSAVLFIPVAIFMCLGDRSIYWWSKHAAELKNPDRPKPPPIRHNDDDPTFNNVNPHLDVDEDEKVEEWLNPPLAVVRGFVYIAIFGALIFWMWRNARTAEYDENLDVARRARFNQRYLGSVGLFVFAITLTFIATDWVMSLEQTFASSMFPVIMFDNAAVMAYSIGLLTLLYFKRKGDPRFAHLFPATEQIHLGSLLLAFTLAWTYFNFSQYMLIWIGNLPEEIPYYLKRTREGWGWYAGLAVIFHFPIPFLLLLFRHVKSSPRALRNICIMLLLVCFADVMWWITPSLSHAEAPKFYWLMDVAAWVGVGGLWVYVFLGQLKKHPLLPTREVYLLEAYHHGH